MGRSVSVKQLVVENFSALHCFGVILVRTWLVGSLEKFLQPTPVCVASKREWPLVASTSLRAGCFGASAHIVIRITCRDKLLL